MFFKTKYLKLKFITFLVFFSFILCLFGIIIFKFQLIFTPKPSSSSISQVSHIKFSTKDSLVNQIHSTNKIIPLELELSQTVSIDASWGDLDILKKYRNITYFAICSYMVDLSKISNNDIYIDSEKKIVSITIPKPEIYLIDFDYRKTKYEEPVNGLLRFGNISISTEDSITIENNVKLKLKEKMLEDSIYSKSTAASKQSISDLLKQILGENFDVLVNFS